MITLTHVSKLPRARALKSLVIALILPIGSMYARSQATPETLIAPKRPGDRLVLWGAFDIDHRPILEFTQLLRRGETPRAPAGYPAYTDRMDGSLNLTLDRGRHLKGSWSRVQRVEWIIPAGERKAGWGWIATVPYVQGARGYELFQGQRDLGGEAFPAPPDRDRVRATPHHAMVESGISSPDDSFIDSDLDSDFTKTGIYIDAGGKPVGVERLWWEIESPHGQPPHGAWMMQIPENTARPGPWLRRGAVQIAWPSNRGHKQMNQASAQVHEWGAASEWWFCFSINVCRPVTYPWRRSVVLRRSFGLQVLEEILPLDMGTEPPLEADNP